nr:tail fiber domain-containing protein [uncultured Blautia sp.]
MIKTTAAYKEALKENGIFHHKVVINFQDGSNDTVEDLDIYTLQISEGTSNTSSFDLGAAIAQQLTLKLNNIDGRFDEHDFNGAVITAQVGLELLNGSVEWLDKGKFTAEPGEEAGNSISVKAFDDMTKFDQSYSLSKLVYPTTLGTIVRDACSCCGVTLASDTATFDNDNFIVQNRPDDSALTFRQVLQWVGQIACKFFKIDRFGKLSAQWYDTELLEATWVQKEDTIWTDVDGNGILDSEGQEIGTVIEIPLKNGNSNIIDADNADEILKISDLLTGSTIQTDDVVITGIRVNEEDGDNTEETTHQYGSDGYVLEISGNKLIQDGSGATVAAYLGERLNGIQFRPMSISTPADPAREAGDLGLVIDAKKRYHKTIFTNVEYTAHTSQNLISGAEAPTRLSSTRYSQATQVYKELRANLKKQKTEWDTAFDNLQEAMKTKNGLFPIHETMEDGSTILYFCDKPELSEATIVVKFSAAGWGMSTDGGKTWNSGWLVDGTMVAAILNVIGVNAKWINAGALTVKDSDGKTIFEVDMDKKSVYMDPDTLTIGGVPLSKKLASMDENIASAKNMTLTLSNEYQGITSDADGNIPTFPTVATTASVMYGSSDITNDCSYTVTKSDSVTGSWDADAHTYTVTGLSADNGWVDIKATYLLTLSITRRFSISKQKSGADGTPGRTYMIEPSCNVLKRSSDNTISPNFVQFKSYYRDGDSATRTAYKGRFVVEETVDGNTWKTIYTSAEDEDTVKHYLYTILTNMSNEILTSSNGSTIGIPRDVTNVRCKLYASGGTTTLMDMQSVAVVIDVAALTQEQIVEILSNDGEFKGLYYLNGHLYISLDALLGNCATLGGKKNGNGYLKIKDANDTVKGLVDRSGYTVFTNYEENSTRMKYTGICFSNTGINPVSAEKYLNSTADVEFVETAWGIDWNAEELIITATEVSANTGTFEDLTVTSSTSFTSPPKIENMEYTTSSNTVCWDGRTGYKQLMLKSSSSKRYKDIGDNITESEADEWYNIEPTWAKYKDGYLVKGDENEGRYIPMFIAEDVEKYFPEATRHANGQVEDWNERIMIPAMFAMIKAQKKKIDQQEKLINILCEKLNIE